MKKLKITDRSHESGNVLFLILIAVALFAALSYAVTQSTRSGGGSTEREQALLGSSAMTQYPTGLRTSVIRMILSGIGVETIKFNPPSDFGVIETDELVFHPEGGGAVYQLSAADVMAGSSQGTWIYNANYEVPQVGIDGSGGNDVIAFLPGVSSAVCKRVNEELNISSNDSNCTYTNAGIPDFAADDAELTELMDDNYTFPATSDDILQGDGASCAVFTGQASGCFNDTTPDPDRFVFFSVLLER